MLFRSPQNADKYEALLKEEIFIGIQSRHIRGFRDIQLLRRQIDEEVEFITIMRFDSLESVREFAGHLSRRTIRLDNLARIPPFHRDMF